MSTPTDFVPLTDYEEAIAEKNSAIAELEELRDEMDHKDYLIEKYARLLFGRKSEKAPAVNVETGAVQKSLFEDEGAYVPSCATDTQDPDPPVDTEKKKKKRRPRFRASLAREEVELEIPIEELQCACGCVKKSIGVEKSEKLEFIPATVKVFVYNRHKYACPNCKSAGVETAAIAMTAFPKSAVTDATRAHLLVQKFVDHLPYYRQSAILDRNGVELSDTTIGRYGIQAADLLSPIALAMCDEVLGTHYIQADETTLRVLKTEKSKPGAHCGYLWAYGVPRGTVVFDYRASRAGRNPEEFLMDFSGAVQTDRYQGYSKVRARSEIIDLACWAHARRKFVEAQKTSARRVKPVLDLIGRLYAVEKDARDRVLSPFERRELRLQKAAPILEKIRTELDQLSPSVRPRSPIGVAVDYALAHWRPLCLYVQLGEVEIDTNLLENSIRPIALGRKNYLFAGSPTGAEAAATIYSITESCRRLGINPYEYLVHVFRAIATTAEPSPDFFRGLTPERYRANRAV